MTGQMPDRTEGTRRPLRRRVVRWGVRVIVVLVVLGVAAYAVANYWAAKTIRDEVAKIRAAGQPLTFADLDAMAPKVEESQDSGPFYAAALALVHDVGQTGPPGYDEAMSRGRLTPAVLAEARRRVDENHLALEMLDRGSKLSGCNYDTELRYGIAVVLPRLNQWRSLARAASLRTRLLAFQGRGDEAANSAVSSLGMLRVFDRQPVLVSHLVKVGCAALFCEDVAAILEHGRPSARALERLEAALSRAERSMDMRKMFMAERVYYLEISRNAVGGGRGWPSANVVDIDKGRSAPPLPGEMPSGLAYRIIVAKSLGVYGRFIDGVSNDDWPGMIDTAKAIAAEPRSRWEAFAKIVAPSFERATVTTARCVAELRSAIVAVKVERYRLANGKLPDDLIQLAVAGELPKDPFTGGPLVYRKTGDGYCVYGLGEERRDAGGKNLNTGGPNWGISVRTTTARPRDGNATTRAVP